MHNEVVADDRPEFYVLRSRCAVVSGRSENEISVVWTWDVTRGGTGIDAGGEGGSEKVGWRDMEKIV